MFYSELKLLRKYFLELDNDGGGTIGVDELLEPLITLGIADNAQHVQNMFDSVDEDGSGQIEFDEFLNLMKVDDENQSNTKLQ